MRNTPKIRLHHFLLVLLCAAFAFGGSFNCKSHDDNSTVTVTSH